MGDVHALGNPHYWLSPKKLSEGARALVDAEYVSYFDTVRKIV
jgi:hypothetical protein